MKKLRVGITHGDFNGVGYEIILKTVGEEGVTELFTPVIFGDARILEKGMREFGIELQGLKVVKSAKDARDGFVNLVDLRLPEIGIEPGHPSKASGAGAVAALEEAVRSLSAEEIDTLVTAPISKEAVQSEAFAFPGHTEYLNDRAGEQHRAQMILFDDFLKVALVTTHLPLSQVAAAVTKEKVVEGLEMLDKVLRQDFGVDRPRIAVLSLNPHCGDGGLLGEEEQSVIIPAMEEAEKKGILSFGPFAADGFFGTGAYTKFDAVLAMYHDQGLAPFKALARENGVNFTAGLPWVRTSPDHGTAYDIAWKGVADPTSMREAIYKGIDIYRARKRYQAASANPLRKAAHHEKTRPDRQNDERQKESTEKPAEPAGNE